MKLCLLILCLTIHSFLSDNVQYDGYKLFKVTPVTREGVQVLQELQNSDNLGYDFWTNVRHVEDPVTIMVSPSNASEFSSIINKSGIISEIVLDNVQPYINKQKSSANTRDQEFGWKRYHTLAEIYKWLTSLPDKYPCVVSLIQLNGTYENRPIMGVRVSYGGNKVKKSIFIEAGIHSREWISPATSTFILNELLTSTDTAVRELAENHDWYFFPVFNPDGYDYTHTTDRFWRKTRVRHSELCYGTDANRNWGFNWNSGGTSANPCSDIYHGPEPFSESCTKLLSDFIRQIGDQLLAYISFHSFSQVILIPYGHTKEHLDNFDLVYGITLKAANVLAKRHGTTYMVGSITDIMYVASGSSTDWVKGTFKTPIVLTYELRDQGEYGFVPPPQQILPTAEETFDSFVALFKEYYKATKN